jgi:hypothetical protein
MPRYMRPPTGGMVCHVLNRANARLPLFECPADYELFEQTLQQAHQRVAMRTLAYCVMPNQPASPRLCRPMLAPGGLAASRRRLGGVHALADAGAHAAVARRARLGRQRARIPGAVQVVPDPDPSHQPRRAAARRRGQGQFAADGAAVRGGQRGSGGAGQAGRAVAVVRPVASHSRRRRPAGPA